MESGKFFVCVVLGLFFLVSGCQDNGKNGDYSGVSDLISDRNKARYGMRDKADSSGQKAGKISSSKSNPAGSGKEDQADTLSSIVLYEEKVKIVGSDSGRTLAEGVAYINKKGRIVRIKISKE